MPRKTQKPKRTEWQKKNGRWTRSIGHRGQRVRLFENRNGVYYSDVWLAGEGRVKRCLHTSDREEADRLGKALLAAMLTATEVATVTKRSAKKLTLGELWEKYKAAEFHALRSKSQQLYTEYWMQWQAMWGEGFVVNDTTLDMADDFRAALDKQGYAVSTIRHALETAKLIYRWAERHELIEKNRLRLYVFKVAKDQRKAPPKEYSPKEAGRILAALNPALSTEWRAWVALSICRYQGVRQNSALHLKWDDIDFKNRLITWQGQWDKLGKTWTQPLRKATEQALSFAATHGAAMNSPWVIPSGGGNGSKAENSNPYTIGALYLQLRKAERIAGVPHLENRGGHGFRRLLAGDVNAVTGNPATAMMAINDDVRQAVKYIQQREDTIADAFARLDATQAAR